jgi:hypothetical protein
MLSIRQKNYFCGMKFYKPFQFLLITLFFFVSYGSRAQFKESTDYNIWSARPGDTFSIYGRMANIRMEPNTTADIQDTLICGSKVIIKEQGTVLENIKGIYAPWVKVEYNSPNSKKEGYVWLGMLALGSFEKNETRFIYGIEKLTAAKNNTDEDYIPAIWYIHVKAIDGKGSILDEKEVTMDGMETSFSSGKLLGDMGLKNTEDIIRINFGGEACGIPTYYYYFGWTGSKLLPLPGKMEVGDAGVFYHTETLLFPKEEGGQPDKILKLSKEGEAEEEKVDKNGEPIFKVKKSREVYMWDGVKAKKKI